MWGKNGRRPIYDTQFYYLSFTLKQGTPQNLDVVFMDFAPWCTNGTNSQKPYDTQGEASHDLHHLEIL